MPSILIYFIPASYIILLPSIFFISSTSFFISLKIFKLNAKEIFKKYFFKVFLSVFFSHIICSIFIFLFGFFTSIFSKNFFSKTLVFLCFFVSIILDYLLLKKIMFLNLKIHKTAKKYISIIISIISSPIILLII